MNRPTNLVPLVEILDSLRRSHDAWARRADLHRLDLIGHRMDAVSVGAQELDDMIESMGSLEERRIERSLALAAEIGMAPTERPPTIPELRSAMGEEVSAPLVDVARRLRDAVLASVGIAERNRILAESGKKIADATVKALAQVVIRSSSTQSAYDRAGAKSRGVAIPVFRRTWRG